MKTKKTIKLEDGRKINLVQDWHGLSLLENYQLQEYIQLDDEEIWQYKDWEGDYFYSVRPAIGFELFGTKSSYDQERFQLKDGLWQSVDPAGTVKIQNGKVQAFTSHELILRKLRIITSFLSDWSVEDVYTIAVRELEQKIAPALSWYEDEIKQEGKTEIEVGGIKYYAPEFFLDLKMYNWVLIEADLLQSGAIAEIYEAGQEGTVVALLARCFFTKNQSSVNQEAIKKNSEAFKKLSLGEAIPATIHALNQISEVREKYARLFKNKNSEESDSKSNSQKQWNDYYEKGGWLAIMEDLGYNTSRESEKSAFYSNTVETVFNAIILRMEHNKAKEVEMKEQEQKRK